MLTLIKREIRDLVVLYIVIGIGAFVLCAWLWYGVRNEIIERIAFNIPRGMVKSFALIWPMYFIMASLGATQMCEDKSKRISTFLGTLATTRKQIFASRLIAGVIAILLLMVPLAIMQFIIIKLIDVGLPFNFSSIYLLNVLCGALLFACYAGGLWVGWRSNTIFARLASVALTIGLFLIVFFKGLTYETAGVLLVFAIACLIRSAYNYLNASL